MEVRPRVLVLICVTLVATACSTAAGPRPTSSAFPPPISTTPTLRLAPADVQPSVSIPQGKYLFVEYMVVNGGTSATCHCPDAAMIDFPGYEFSGGILRAVPGPLTVGEGILGYAGYGQANTGAMGGGAFSQLQPITAVPFSLPYDAAIIHSVDADGQIVAEIEGVSYLIAPGESWIHTREWDPTADCHRTATTRLMNFGLLDRSQIEGD